MKIDHWQRLEPLLKKSGKDYEVLVEKKQGHGFRDEKASIEFYRRMEQFLARHLAPDHAAGPVGQPNTLDLPAKP